MTKHGADVGAVEKMGMWELLKLAQSLGVDADEVIRATEQEERQLLDYSSKFPGSEASWSSIGRWRAPITSTTSISPARTGYTASRSTGMVICYGLFGFDYILPATFLPALARELVDDPQVFGLAWPVFGLAAAVSTVVAARSFGRASRLRLWASGHLLMAAGVVLPSLWLSPATIAIAALLVGGTFMVVTMAGLQEARARAPAIPP